MGAIETPSAFAAKYGVEDCKYVDELFGWLAEHPATSSAADGPRLHTLFGLNSDTGESGPPLPNFRGFDQLASTSAKLRAVAVEVRVLKSPLEIAYLQRCNDIASDAHMAVMRQVPGGAHIGGRGLGKCVWGVG
jgi:hypothetical protein